MNDQETRDKKQTIINSSTIKKANNPRKYDLEERTTVFSKAIIRLCKKLQLGLINNRIIDQLIRSSGSVGANYREANDALGKKDFIMRMRITRKEAKESFYWLNLLSESNSTQEQEISMLMQEARELINIFSSIINKVEGNRVIRSVSEID